MKINPIWSCLLVYFFPLKTEALYLEHVWWQTCQHCSEAVVTHDKGWLATMWSSIFLWKGMVSGPQLYCRRQHVGHPTVTGFDHAVVETLKSWISQWVDTRCGNGHQWETQLWAAKWRLSCHSGDFCCEVAAEWETLAALSLQKVLKVIPCVG